MKTNKMYIAYQAEIDNSDLSDLHLTICFTNIKETSKLHLYTVGSDIYSHVEDIVYWDHCDLTVALLNLSEDLIHVRKELDVTGFTYDHVKGFVPHITLGKGDLVSKYDYLKHSVVTLHSPYFRIKAFEEPKVKEKVYWYIASDVEGCFHILEVSEEFVSKHKDNLEKLLDKELLFEWYSRGCLINDYGKYQLISSTTKTEQDDPDIVIDVLHGEAEKEGMLDLASDLLKGIERI